MIIIWRMTDGNPIARALSDHRGRSDRDHLLMGKVREGEDTQEALLSADYLSPNTDFCPRSTSALAGNLVMHVIIQGSQMLRTRKCKNHPSETCTIDEQNGDKCVRVRYCPETFVLSP